MKKLGVFIIVLCIGLLGTFSYKVTGAFLNDTETSTDNIFAAADSFGPTATPTPTNTPTPTLTPTSTPTPTPTPSVNHMVINEVGSHGDKKKEWVELYNPTSSSIDVSGWKITDNTETDVFPAVTPIPAGGYAVIVPNDTDVVIPSSAITITLTNNDIGNKLGDDGDELHLKNSSDTVIDEVNYGNNTNVFNPAPVKATASKSLARSPNGVDTNTAADWVVDTTPSIGVAN